MRKFISCIKRLAAKDWVEAQRGILSLCLGVGHLTGHNGTQNRTKSRSFVDGTATCLFRILYNSRLIRLRSARDSRWSWCNRAATLVARLYFFEFLSCSESNLQQSSWRRALFHHRGQFTAGLKMHKIWVYKHTHETDKRQTKWWTLWWTIDDIQNKNTLIVK